MTKVRPGQPAVHKTEVELIDRRYDHPDATLLLRAFRGEQVERYGFADPIEADPSEFEDPNGVFLMAYSNNKVAACAGLHWFDRQLGVAELKKLYVVPLLRGHGLGRLLVAALEKRAFERGVRQIILESGIRNKAALHLFESLGYKPIPGYVLSRDPAVNRAFVKVLTSEFDLPGRGPDRSSCDKRCL
jgi:GNAT superfamily N-acetyltransferase